LAFKGHVPVYPPAHPYVDDHYPPLLMFRNCSPPVTPTPPSAFDAAFRRPVPCFRSSLSASGQRLDPIPKIVINNPPPFFPRFPFRALYSAAVFSFFAVRVRPEITECGSQLSLYPKPTSPLPRCHFPPLSYDDLQFLSGEVPIDSYIAFFLGVYCFSPPLNPIKGLLEDFRRG